LLTASKGSLIRFQCFELPLPGVQLGVMAGELLQEGFIAVVQDFDAGFGGGQVSGVALYGAA